MFSHIKSTVRYESLNFLGYPGYRIGDDTTVWRKQVGPDEWAKLSCFETQWGYLAINLSHDGKKRQFFLHRLMLMAFIGPCPEGYVSCHNNGDKQDNRLANLRWDTQANNLKDKVRHGTHPEGEKHAMAKITRDKVVEIRDLYKTGRYSYTDLQRKFGLHRRSIKRIVEHKQWRCVK